MVLVSMYQDRGLSVGRRGLEVSRDKLSPHASYSPGVVTKYPS